MEHNLTVSARRYKSNAFCETFMLLTCLVLSFITVSLCLESVGIIVYGDNFTDIFFTNSFRGSFEWIQKFDFVGKIMQIVISVFSLIGVALFSMRVMTTFVYLSSKGLWDEVSELKTGPSDGKDIFGVVGSLKTWTSGKSGTGLDAIIGAVLILLPDIKKYSDAGKHSGGNFSEDMTMGKYALSIALPFVICTFIFAMGFNGTLWQAMAISVDALGSVADKAISVDYAGYVDDIVNSGIGYKFSFSLDDSAQGKLKQSMAKDIYGKIISKGENLNQAQLYAVGQRVEEMVSGISAGSDALVSDKVKELAGTDRYWKYMGYETVVNTSPTAPNETLSISVGEALSGAGLEGGQEMYIHVFVKQVTAIDGNYFEPNRGE